MARSTTDRRCRSENYVESGSTSSSMLISALAPSEVMNSEINSAKVPFRLASEGIVLGFGVLVAGGDPFVPDPHVPDCLANPRKRTLPRTRQPLHHPPAETRWSSGCLANLRYRDTITHLPPHYQGRHPAT